MIMLGLVNQDYSTSPHPRRPRRWPRTVCAGCPRPPASWPQPAQGRREWSGLMEISALRKSVQPDTKGSSLTASKTLAKIFSLKFTNWTGWWNRLFTECPSERRKVPCILGHPHHHLHDHQLLINILSLVSDLHTKCFCLQSVWLGLEWKYVHSIAQKCFKSMKNK